MGFGYAVYFTERDKNRVVRWDPDTGDAEVVAGEPKNGNPDQTLNSPYGLAFDKNHALLIADKHNHRICQLAKGRLEPLTLNDVHGTRAPRPDSSPSYDPNYLCPTGLFSEKEGSLLSTFSGDCTIFRIKQNGDLEHLLGIPWNRNHFFSGLQETVAPRQIPETPILIPTNIVKRRDGTIFFIERGPNVLRAYHPTVGLRCIFPYALWWQHSKKDHAPDRASFKEYHPGHPTSIVLDADDNLYMTELLHGCVLAVDIDRAEVRKVIEVKDSHRAGGIAAMAFGPDGTAWVLNSANKAVEAYAPARAGHWKDLGIRLTKLRGEPLQLPLSGSGLVLGN